jgi:hypothetical protein
MSREARQAISDPDTNVEFYEVPVHLGSSRRVCALFDTPTGRYWALGPSTHYYHKREVVGVELRDSDKRWCWIVEDELTDVPAM